MTISDRKIAAFIVLFCSCLCLFQTVKAKDHQDTLAKYSYRELDNLVFEHRSDSLKMSKYLSYYLQKARKEKHNNWDAIYYKSFVFYQKEEDRLPFIDSALYYAYQSNDKALIASTYLTKATVYHNIKDYQQALDHYLIADDYIIQTDDVYNRYRIKNHIAGIKSYLGYYEEAEALFEECVRYFGQVEADYNMHRGYISSMLGLAWSYTKTDRITESVQLLATAQESAEKMGFSELDVHYLVFKQGINDYYLGDYDGAIQKIEQKLPFLYENEDFAWASIGEFYIGKSWWDQGDREKAIVYFDMIDEVFQAHQYTHPDLREAYELLINHYKDLDNKDEQLRYIGQLVKADSVFNQNHKYLINNIYKRYTTRELILSKRTLETALYIQKNKTMLIMGLSGIILLLVFAWIYYQRRKTRKIVQELIQKVEASQMQPEPVSVFSSEILKDPGKASIQMKDEVVERLLRELNQFEEKKQFLGSDTTLEKLAVSFETNTTYLSHVINTYKNQKFSQYLNTLRINYLIKKMVLNDDPRIFNYSIEHLAELIGYNSTSAFSRAFKNHTKVKPSSFIKRMKSSA